MLRWGYRIPLSRDPPLSHTPVSLSGYSDREMDAHLAAAVEKLIAKGAVEEVRNIHTPGFYSRVFLRPKSSGGWRPIIDLSTLNPFIKGERQKQETQHQIRSALRQHQWAISVDLTDAFFHVAIHPKSRHLLRFTFKDKVFQYAALPFGLKTAPWIFTRVVTQLQTMPQVRQLEIHFYLDDWICPVDSYPQGLAASQSLTSLCNDLGLLVNQEKSELIPSQQFTYIGGRYDLHTYLVCPKQENLLKIADLGGQFLQATQLPARTWLRLIGLLHSQEKFTSYGRRRLRHIQWCLKLQWQIATHSLSHMVTISPEARSAIRWWTTESNTTRGTPIRLPPPHIEVQTDASVIGWGGHSGHRTFSGTWTEQEALAHINVLELRAVTLTLRELKPPPQVHILVHTDNSTVMAYVNKQGGVKSWQMWQETNTLLQLAEENQWLLSAKHVPGHLNVLADLLSRRHQVIQTEWQLHKEVVKLLSDKWGDPNIDLFATRLNHQMLLYVSPVPDPGAWAVDALSIEWNNLSAYAFPPPQILPQVLEKVRQCSNLRLILVAPMWDRHPWHKALTDLATEGPIPLPAWRNLLKQPHTGVLHPAPSTLKLGAWLLVKGHC